MTLFTKARIQIHCFHQVAVTPFCIWGPIVFYIPSHVMNWWNKEIRILLCHHCVLDQGVSTQTVYVSHFTLRPLSTIWHLNINMKDLWMDRLTDTCIFLILRGQGALILLFDMQIEWDAWVLTFGVTGDLWRHSSIDLPGTGKYFY